LLHNLSVPYSKGAPLRVQRAAQLKVGCYSAWVERNAVLPCTCVSHDFFADTNLTPELNSLDMQSIVIPDYVFREESPLSVVSASPMHVFMQPKVNLLEKKWLLVPDVLSRRNKSAAAIAVRLNK